MFSKAKGSRGLLLRVGFCAAIIGAVGTTVLVPPRPRLVWNASASAPIGLWRVFPDAPIGRGDMVVARLTEPWRGYAARRRYLPANVPLIKRIAAAPGDIVCAVGSHVVVNGTDVGRRKQVDRLGRDMPKWCGCILLREGRYLLLMDAPSSFDGRYFGPTARGDIIGKAHPLWLR